MTFDSQNKYVKFEVMSSEMTFVSYRVVLINLFEFKLKSVKYSV